MTKKERALLAVEALKKEYPGAVCSLEYQDPLQLLIATRLSAQCTDARVNLVTPALCPLPYAGSLLRGQRGRNCGAHPLLRII